MASLSSYILVLLIGLALGVMLGNDNIRQRIKVWSKLHIGKRNKAKRGRPPKRANLND